MLLELFAVCPVYRGRCCLQKLLTFQALPPSPGSKRLGACGHFCQPLPPEQYEEFTTANLTYSVERPSYDPADQRRFILGNLTTEESLKTQSF